MPECTYCGEEFDREADFVQHLISQHDLENISRIDRKRVEVYQSESASTAESVASLVSGVNRRQALGIAAAVTSVGGAGIVANRRLFTETLETGHLHGEWSIGPNLPYQAEYPAVTAYDGELYIFGGAEEENVPQADAYKFDPDNREWTELTPMPVEGHRITATRIESRIYIIDGRTQQQTFGDGSVRIYNIEADSWSMGSTRPVTTRDAGQTTDGEEIYMFGGNFGGNNTEVAHAYNPESDNWRELSPLPFPNRQMSCHYVPTDSLIYLFGGESPGDGPERDDVITYDPETDTYDDLPTNMPEPSQTIPSTVHNGQVLFAGGEEPGGTVGSRTFRVYDPESDRWGTLPDLINMVEATDCVVLNDKLFVPGGRTYFEPNTELDEEPHTYRYEDYPVFHDRMQIYQFDS